MSFQKMSLPMICHPVLSTILCVLRFSYVATSDLIVPKENSFTKSLPLLFVLLVNGLFIVTVFKCCDTCLQPSVTSPDCTNSLSKMFLTLSIVLPLPYPRVKWLGMCTSTTCLSSVFLSLFSVFVSFSENFSRFLIDLPASRSPKPFS